MLVSAFALRRTCMHIIAYIFAYVRMFLSVQSAKSFCYVLSTNSFMNDIHKIVRRATPLR
jgi:hypothetical protein